MWELGGVMYSWERFSNRRRCIWYHHVVKESLKAEKQDTFFYVVYGTILFRFSLFNDWKYDDVNIGIDSHIAICYGMYV